MLRRVAVAIAFLMLAPAVCRALPPRPVYAVLFTHIEDATPGGTLGTVQNRNNYLLVRGALISMADLARDRDVPWSLQPDWKILRAALLYENDSLMALTNGKNFLRYLREDLGVTIDPHSHENGHNYTDVAHLLDSLGVGGSTVIGGHIWDPGLQQFQEWDRYRVPVPGEMYPNALWRGDILMGSGTPNHVNDPVVSGVWRPRDRDHYFDDDPAGNIAAVGAYRSSFDGVTELRDLYRTGRVQLNCMLTTSYPIRPATIVAPGGIASIEDTILTPAIAMRDSGALVLTNFTALVETWRTEFGARGFLYDANAVVGIDPESVIPGAGVRIESCSPNPVSVEAQIRISVSHPARVVVEIHDVLGRRRALLSDETRPEGAYGLRWRPGHLPNGVYFCRVSEIAAGQRMVASRAIVVRR